MKVNKKCNFTKNTYINKKKFFCDTFPLSLISKTQFQGEDFGFSSYSPPLFCRSSFAISRNANLHLTFYGALP